MLPTANGHPAVPAVEGRLAPYPPAGGYGPDEPDYFHDVPTLAALGSAPRWKGQQPFAGKTVLMVLHFLANLLPFVKAAQHNGLQPAATTLFYKDYPYPNKEYVTRQLRSWGYDVRPTTDIGPGFITELRAKTIPDGCPILVIEDGGYLTPTLLRDPELGSRVIGTVEQTAKGVWAIEEAINAAGRPAPFPVLSLPHCELKQTFEPPHIANGAVTAVENLLYRRCVCHMNAAVLGCGTIGANLVEVLARRVKSVTFFDPDPKRQARGMNLPGTVADSAATAVRGADLVFGACGRRSVTADVIRATKHGVWLVSVSSEQVEIDIDHLETSSPSREPIKLHQVYVSDPTTNPTIGTRYYLRPGDKKVNLLADGMPVNFMGGPGGMVFGGMPDQAADLIMSLIFVAAAELAGGRYANRQGVQKNAINKLVEKHGVCELYRQFWG